MFQKKIFFKTLKTQDKRRGRNKNKRLETLETLINKIMFMRTWSVSNAFR